MYVCLTPFRQGGGIHFLKVFLCCHKYQLIGSKLSVFNFLVWRHALTKNEVDNFHSFCRKHLTNLSLYLYRISVSTFSSSWHLYLALISVWVKKHTVGHIFIKRLKFSKFIADISIAQDIRNFDNFTGFLQSRI